METGLVRVARNALRLDTAAAGVPERQAHRSLRARGGTSQHDTGIVPAFDQDWAFVPETLLRPGVGP